MTDRILPLASILLAGPRKLGRPVDLMTIGLERRSASAGDMVVEWDRTRVRVPVVLSHPGGGGGR